MTYKIRCERCIYSETFMEINANSLEEAMEIAEKEHNKYNKPTKTTVRKRVSTSTPVWFNENVDSTPVSGEEKEELENLLKSFR